MYQFNADQFATDIFRARPQGLRRLARRVGVAHQSVYDIERRRTRPSVPVFLALCRELGLSPTDYIEGEGNKLQPGSYVLDMGRLAAALERRPMPYMDSYRGDTPVSHCTTWRIRNGIYHAPYMQTWLGLCEWVQTPPSAFLVAT